MGGTKGSSFSDMITKLAGFDAIFLGETHNRLDHHANQLEIICRLHARHPNLAVGIEYLPGQAQPALDAYVHRELSEIQMLSRTEYFDRWRFDFRLYSGLFRFARANSIPVVALNLPSELTRPVGARGIADLAPKQRKRLPKLDFSDQGYEQRLRQVFDNHPHSDKAVFRHFLEAQLLWDEGMAATAATYLQAHPDRQLVVLAGSGHVEYGSGIPNRLRRRTGKAYVSVLTRAVADGEMSDDAADWILDVQDLILEPSPKMGVLLDVKPDKINVLQVVEGGGAMDAGILPGDTITSIGDRRILRFADVRLALWQRTSGDEVEVTVRRQGAEQPIKFNVILR